MWWHSPSRISTSFHALQRGQIVALRRLLSAALGTMRSTITSSPQPPHTKSCGTSTRSLSARTASPTQKRRSSTDPILMTHSVASSTSSSRRRPSAKPGSWRPRMLPGHGRWRCSRASLAQQPCSWLGLNGRPRGSRSAQRVTTWWLPKQAVSCSLSAWATHVWSFPCTTARWANLLFRARLSGVPSWGPGGQTPCKFSVPFSLPRPGRLPLWLCVLVPYGSQRPDLHNSD
mmetsp:Transcript_14365/g.38937  ORF Transcript_14365/g.38937 Transcript_14365/m.38937 type:complete len:231 (-) Transcript_14365:4-696(-)